MSAILKKGITIVGLIASMMAGSAAFAASEPAAGSFVKRQGNQLMLGSKVFRFAGANMPWLGLDIDIKDQSGNPTYPTHFRIDNALDAAKSMNATVVRSHTLGVSVGCAKCLEPTLGQFNDAAFEPIDYAIAAAGKKGLRLIIPLTDQWGFYHGGETTFTQWRGKQKADFYTDANIIADFKLYLNHLLNHVNQYTGLALKDDPTILAWETGNEIWDAKPAWTQEIAAHLKHQLNAKQLVADGMACTGCDVQKMAIDKPDVDMVGLHFYPFPDNTGPLDYVAAANTMKANAALARQNNKVFFVGEFDWTGNRSWTANKPLLANFLLSIEGNSDIAGDLYWTLMPHKEDGSPEMTGERFTIHYPGDNADMQEAVKTLSSHAGKFSASVPNPTPTPTPTPTPPSVLGTGSYNDSSLSYTGNWSVSSGTGKYNSDDHYSADANASAKVGFTGTQVKLFGAKASHHGIAAVRIDGGSETMVDLYSASRQEQALIYTSPALAKGTHTVEVRVTGNKNAQSSGTVAALDRIDVIDAPTTTPVPAPPPSLSPGTYNDTSLSYTGDWGTSSGAGKYGGDDHYSTSTGASASVRFTGVQVELYAAKASHHGIAAIRIDNGQETLVDLYSANRQEQALFYTSPVLAKGTHTLQIRVTGSKNAQSSGAVVAIDRLDVIEDAPPASPPSLKAGSYNDTALSYAGSWNVSTGPAKYNGDDHYSDSVNATATVSFTGTQIKLTAAKANHHGIAAIRIDNGSETMVDLYSASRQDQAVIYTSPVMTKGAHTISIRVTGNRNPQSYGAVIALDRLDVIDAPAAPAMRAVSAGTP